MSTLPGEIQRARDLESQSPWFSAGLLVLAGALMLSAAWFWETGGCRTPMGGFWVFSLGGFGAVLFFAALGPWMKKWLGAEAAALTLVVFVFLYPGLSGFHTPSHDSLHAFQIFQFYYQSFFFCGDIAQWLPHSSYGIPAANMQISQISPMGYLVMALGRIFSIKDALCLFRLSIFLEYLVLISGMILLGKRLGFSALAVIFTGIAAACTAYWDFQINFNLRLIYLLPLALYFVVSYFETQNPARFWLCGITFVAALIGGLPYFAGLWLFMLFFFCLPFFIQSPQKAASPLFSISRKNLYPALGFAVLAFGVVFFALHASDFIFLAKSRDPVTGRITLETFLTWPPNMPDAEFIRSFKSALTGWPLMRDNTLYRGILPLVFLIFAALHARGRAAAGFAVSGMMVFLLSFGGLLAAVSFFFPGMSFSRYLILFQALSGFLFLFLAGMGLDRFLDRTDRASKAVLVAVLFLVLADAVGAPFIQALILNDGRVPPLGQVPAWIVSTLAGHPMEEITNGFETGAAALFVFRAVMVSVGFFMVAGLGIFSRAVKDKERLFRQAAGLILIAVLIVDLASFRYMFQSYRPQTQEAEFPKEMVEIRPMTFEPVRVREEDALPEKARSLAFVEQKDGMHYTTSYDWAGVDPCFSHLFSSGYTAAAIRLYNLPQEIKQNPPENLAATLGCGEPKLRFVNRVLWARSVEEAEKLVFGPEDLTRAVILYGEAVENSGLQPLPEGAPATIRIQVQHFTPNQMVVNVKTDGEKPGMLVYSQSITPAWRASVDGNPAPLFQSYPAFMAVPVPPGDHEVVFFYDAGPVSWMARAVAVVGALLGLLLLAAYLAILCCPALLDSQRPPLRAKDAAAALLRAILVFALILLVALALFGVPG